MTPKKLSPDRPKPTFWPAHRQALPVSDSRPEPKREEEGDPATTSRFVLCACAEKRKKGPGFCACAVVKAAAEEAAASVVRLGSSCSTALAGDLSSLLSGSSPASIMSYGPLETYRPGGLPPRDFGSIIQTCSANVQRLAQCTSQIKNLMSQLGTKQDSSKLQENLQQLQHTANRLAKETNEYLKELGSLPLPLSTSEQRQQKLQKERLMNDFSTALNNFQAVQRRVSEKEKETIARARAGSRLSNQIIILQADEKHREEQLVSFNSNEEWNQMQSQEEDVAITEQDLELIKERETAIRQLEADILDVNQIFKDLAMMIHDQGDIIDSIEANVETAEVHVENANEQLQRAAYYQKKSRKKICILVLGLAVVVLILVLIIWYTSN
ncbi:hypothetical protein JD844_005563 [Phrynosoma platyrhinos]|uniref:t-SNARE coiled-coil homology domain-containing protein n=1 Tax=Phrynosoma platyrhinos TaxID=52577 RepID=A0ABQ7TQ30_PHRPL|nr:hypothetical protein JD844_005563 [Phrynosoma platyrhinos]